MAATLQLIQQACQEYKHGRHEDATRTCELILAHEPENLDALRIAGVMARDSRNLQKAIGLLEQAVSAAAARPTVKMVTYPHMHPGALLCFELAGAYRQANRYDDAIMMLQQSLSYDSRLQESLVNMAGMLENLNRPNEALPYALKAVEVKPLCATAHYNLANVLRLLGQIDAAISNYRRCLTLNPDYAKAHMNLAVCYLLSGRFRDAWRHYEWREQAGEVMLDRFPQPRWDGLAAPDKTLVIHAEQGIGDEIMFASCFEEAMKHVGKTIVVCDPRLSGLFARSFPKAKVVGYQRRKDWQPVVLDDPVDVQIPAGSLPSIYRTSSDSFPKRERYLHADPGDVSMWRQRFAELGREPKIGISWRAGGKPDEHRKRTTSLLAWRELLTQPGVQFINLQYGECIDEMAEVHRHFGVKIHDFEAGDPLVDLDGFAAKVAALDLVISVGNATVHVAGALGTPAWAILPKLPGWRWLLDGETMPWYSSVRLIRQATAGEWDPVFQRVAGQLRTHFGLAQTPSSQIELTVAERTRLPQPPPNPTVFRPVETGNQWSQEQIAEVFDKALSRHQSGDLLEAERIYREILRHAPRHPDALHLLGVIGQQTGRLDLAITSIRRALCVHPNVAIVRYNFAAALKDAGRLSEAVAEYRRAAELQPEMAEAHLHLGICLREQGDIAEATKALQTALALAPGSATARLHLGHCARTQCHIDRAIEYYQAAIRLKPDLVKAHLGLGATLLDDGAWGEAVASFQQAIKLAPDYAPSHIALGTAWRIRGKLPVALSHLLRAAELDPDSFDVFFAMAKCLLEMGKLHEAARCFSRSLEIRPNDPAALAALAPLQSGSATRHLSGPHSPKPRSGIVLTPHSSQASQSFNLL